MRKTFFGLAAAAIIGAMTMGGADAATVIASNCVSVASANGCLFSGNINLNLSGNNSLGAADDAYNNRSPAPSPLLDLAGMTYKADATSGKIDVMRFMRFSPSGHSAAGSPGQQGVGEPVPADG